MAFTFPDWYEGEFEDMELVIKQVLDKHFAEMTPVPSVYAWLPDDWRDNLPVVSIARTPAILGEKPQLDRGLVHVWCVCDRRSDSWALANFVRTVLGAYKSGAIIDMPDGSRADLRSVLPAEGPELSMADTALSERVIPLSFFVTVRQPSGTPDYTEIT